MRPLMTGAIRRACAPDGRGIVSIAAQRMGAGHAPEPFDSPEAGGTGESPPDPAPIPGPIAQRIPRRTALATLRDRIARLEAQEAAKTGFGTPASTHFAARPVVPLGVGRLDERLGGGLLPGALHEIRSADADGPLAFGFALALAARLTAANREVSARGPVPHSPVPHAPLTGTTLIVSTFDGAGEWGRPYGPGLAAFGLDPDTLLLVEARRPREALWAAEEGLACRALSAVVTEIRGDPPLVDLTATRRLVLRAARSGVTAILVRPGTADGLSAARTRWRIAPHAVTDPTTSTASSEEAPSKAPSEASLETPFPFCLSPPAWEADLERNAAPGASRPGGRFSLMWTAHDHRFTDAASLSANHRSGDRYGQDGSRAALSGAAPAASAAGAAGATTGGSVIPIRHAG